MTGGSRGGRTPSLSARRTSSASDLAAILRMIWPRWTPIVTSLIPSSPAVRLFAKPATTNVRTSRSRGVSRSAQKLLRARAKPDDIFNAFQSVTGARHESCSCIGVFSQEAQA